MHTANSLRSRWGLALATLGLWSGHLHAGTASFDFNEDPTAILTTYGSSVWRPTGGVDSTGYLSITDAANGQGGVIVFDDFDNGNVVNSFTFSCDLRTGGGTGDPADGYSVSFARESDPVVASGTGFAASPGGEGNLPEEGTTTGISVGLDEWDSGSGDVIGLSVRVDNTLVNQTALAVKNGEATNTNSLQTGPAGRPIDGDFNVADHTFVNLTITLEPDGTLDVSYKGRKVLDNFQTTYFPSRGRLVFAGRTGGANSHHHVDNIQITTAAASLPTLTSSTLSALDFAATITDSALSKIDINKPITVTIDGTTVAATKSKTGADTSLAYASAAPNFYAPGNHEVVIRATDTNNNNVELTRTVVTSNYTLLSESWKAAAGQVDTTTPSFLAFVHQINFGRYPGDSNLTPLPERQLYNGYFDGAINAIAANVAIPGEQPDGTTVVQGPLNWDQDAAQQGNFGGETLIPGIPGTTSSTDNIVGEIFTWLQLPAGTTRLGVNSDDGFTVSFGSTALDHFTRVKAGEFNGGRGASDTTFDIAVPSAGLYPVRLLWWEGGGGANLEFFSVRADGTKVLINDTVEADAIKGYHLGLPLVPSIQAVAPYPSPAVTNNDPRHPILINLVDGVATVNDASIVLTVDGVAVTPVVASEDYNTTVTYSPAGLWAPGNHTVALSYTNSASAVRTESWTFNIVNYVSLNAADGFPAASASVPGYTASVYQVAGIDPTPETVNWNEVADDMLAGIYGENVADLSTATNGIFSFPGTLNWDQDSAQQGNFGGETPIPGIPGTTGSTDNIAAEVLTYLVFPAPGIYNMGVNSDDCFRVTLGHDGPKRHLFQLTGSATISGPHPSVDGTRSFGSIGAPLNGLLEGAVVAAEPILADVPLTNAAAVAGKIVYIDRGVVPFATKILNAQAAGAIGVIIGTSNAGFPITMGGDPAGINIPAVMTTQSAGTAIKASLAAGEPLRASLGYDTAPRFGEFQGGRGASDTTFIFGVNAAGAYPVRLIWKEGGGGANLEWFSVLNDGTKVLINDESNPNSIKAFQMAGTPSVTPVQVDLFTVDRTAGTFSLTWKSTAGSSYRIESSPSLRTGTWTVVADNVAASAGATTTFLGNSAVNPQLPNVTAEPQILFRVLPK